MTSSEDGIDFMSKNEAISCTTSCSSVRAPTALRCAVCMPLRSGTRRSNRASQEDQSSEQQWRQLTFLAQPEASNCTCGAAIAA